MTTAIEADEGRVEAHELLELVTRLEEVRRRFVREGGDGDRFDLAEERLDSVILDLRGWLKPGGEPADAEDLALRLAALEEMFEGLGLAGYAHVVGSVAQGLSHLGQDVRKEDSSDPPPPRRFVPPPRAASPGRRSRSRAAGFPEGRGSPQTVRRRPAGWLVVVLAAVGVAAAFVFDLIPFGNPLSGRGTPAAHRVTAAPETSEPVATPRATPVLAPRPQDDRFRAAARSLGDLVQELEASESALGKGDLDGALQHFAAAAAIDRHHRGVVALADGLIKALLRESDADFDRAEWDLAAKRVDDARHLARGLYLDTTAIEQTARRHQAMTRFVDLDPGDRARVRDAVGRAVRVTLTTGDQLLGRLEAFDGDRLALSIQSGVAGGGVRFDKELLLGDTSRIRVYDASHPSQVILGEEGLH